LAALLSVDLGFAQTDGRLKLAAACPDLAARCSGGFAGPDFDCMLKDGQADLPKMSAGGCRNALRAALAVPAPSHAHQNATAPPRTRPETRTPPLLSRMEQIMRTAVSGMEKAVHDSRPPARNSHSNATHRPANVTHRSNVTHQSVPPIKKVFAEHRKTAQEIEAWRAQRNSTRSGHNFTHGPWGNHGNGSAWENQNVSAKQPWRDGDHRPPSSTENATRREASWREGEMNSTRHHPRDTNASRGDRPSVDWKRNSTRMHDDDDDEDGHRGKVFNKLVEKTVKMVRHRIFKEPRTRSHNATRVTEVSDSSDAPSANFVRPMDFAPIQAPNPTGV